MALVAALVALVGMEQAISTRPAADRGALLSGHHFPVLAVAFDPACTALTSAAAFPTNPRDQIELIVWDLTKRTPLQSRSGFDSNLATLALSSDGMALATGTRTGALSWWEIAASRGSESAITCAASLTSLAFSPSGTILASSTLNNEVLLCDRAGKRLWSVRAGFDRFAQTLAFAPDERMLVGGGTDGVVRGWDVSSGKCLRAFAGHSTPIVASAFSPDGGMLATGDWSGAVKIWKVSNGRELCSFGESEPNPAATSIRDDVSAMVFSPNGQTLAVAKGSTLRLWDTSTWKLGLELLGQAGKVHSLAFSNDSMLLAAGGHNGQIRIWDLAQASTRSP